MPSMLIRHCNPLLGEVEGLNIKTGSLFLGYLDFHLSGECSWSRYRKFNTSYALVELSGDDGGAIPVLKELSV